MNATTKSLKVLYKTFACDFDFAVNEHSDHLAQNNDKLDFFHCSQVLQDLGMLRGKSKFDICKERILYVEMWKDLMRDEGIRPMDLKVYLEAILGFQKLAKNKKRMHLTEENLELLDQDFGPITINNTQSKAI